MHGQNHIKFDNLRFSRSISSVKNTDSEWQYSF